MSKKKISVICMDPLAASSYAEDIRSLFGDVAQIDTFSVWDGTATGVLPPADVYAATTDAYGSAEEFARHVPPGSQTMWIEVSFRWDTLNRLKEIPGGSKVLFVNMTPTMAREAVSQLEQLGINHVKWISYYPGLQLPSHDDIHVAVTPDEERYVPDWIDTTINLGQRTCTTSMVVEIALRLGLDYLLETEPFQNYFHSIATSNYGFDQMFARSTRLESQFHILMENLRDGVIAINEKGVVYACNQHAQDMTGVNFVMNERNRCTELFPYIPFTECLQSTHPMPVKLIKVNGANLSIEVIPVIRNGACIGAFAILQRFNEMEERQNELRSQLFQKGHYAKYSFDDVIGRSEAILHTKQVLRRMAQSESPVLLIGETGTGKELFAHGIHRESRRSGGPFVAINVAAFPENLLESELFGYEEGAFTGAKRGGKPGLFEFAHKGTLFLDEVEGMSASLQVMLLRALQEREIMRVGGKQIIHVDVRIVAATNESLEEKVRQGTFRRDLYYRLSTLPVVIPPLSQRGDDLFLLVDHFRQELGGNFTLSPQVLELFRSYAWPGNIRELRNVVEYLVYTGSREITFDDLPPTLQQAFSLHQSAPAAVSSPAQAPAAAPQQSAAFRFVLEQLYQASQLHQAIGRDKILEAARDAYLPLSQQELRAMLAEMSRQGLVRVSRGRGGSQLTPEGRKLVENG